jgi:hypothetical protein
VNLKMTQPPEEAKKVCLGDASAPKASKERRFASIMILFFHIVGIVLHTVLFLWRARPAP